jgi:hypothetical protein
MNGTEQREHHTAVERAERRIADAELVVLSLAEDLVAHGQKVTRDLAAFNDRLALFHEIEAARLDNADRLLALRIDALERRLETFTEATRWQRIRWALSF